MCESTNNNHQPIRGTGLEHGTAHRQDHQHYGRRNFLRHLGLVGASTLLINKLPLRAVGHAPLAQALNSGDTEDRILVLIRLKGGNDGLNTVIPLFDYGTYRNYRPGLAINQQEAIGLNTELGLHPSLQPLERLWQNDRMKILNNVGYPDHNLSHFASTDIWTSSDSTEPIDTSGWLGRLLDRQYPDYLTTPPAEPLAIQIGGNDNTTFDNEDGFNLAVSTANPEQLARIGESGQLFDPLDVPDCYYGEQLSYLRSVANTTSRYASVIGEAYNVGTNSVEYPSGFGQQLALVARLIRGQLGTRMYLVTLDGFDTHAGQLNQHAYLLAQLAEAIDAFYQDISAAGREQDVLAMTFSEFGRRPEQNASQGTDHGAAAPLFVFGPGLNGSGFLGGLPDLIDLDTSGNLKHTLDFRQLYATVLEQWLCVDGAVVDQVLGTTYDRLPELGISCSPTTSIFNPSIAPEIGLTAFQQPGQLTVRYQLPTPGRVQIQLYDLQGRQVANLFQGFQTAGPQEVVKPFSVALSGGGVFVCALRYRGRVFSRKIQVVQF